MTTSITACAVAAWAIVAVYLAAVAANTAAVGAHGVRTGELTPTGYATSGALVVLAFALTRVVNALTA